jgi:hypothetical protein
MRYKAYICKIETQTGVTNNVVVDASTATWAAKHAAAYGKVLSVKEQK